MRGHDARIDLSSVFAILLALVADIFVITNQQRERCLEAITGAMLQLRERFSRSSTRIRCG
jgi:hypothetical protein